MKTSFTVRDINNLIKQLEDEKDPSNDELIAFYKKRVLEVITGEMPKAMKKAFGQNKTNRKQIQK